MHKKVLIILFCSNILLTAQNNNTLLFKGEAIIHLFNYNNELVELKADRIKGQGGKWYPNSFDNAGKLIRNNEFDNVILNNFIPSSEDPANIIFIDLEGDDGYEYTIARSFYKIYFPPENQGKS